MTLEKRERLKIFLERLKAHAPARTAEEAFNLVARILNEVEDEFTTIPFDPTQWRNDGRMYPPMPDSARDVDGRPDITRYRSAKHNTCIGANGAIQIRTLDGVVLLDKPGQDGISVNVP